MSDAAWAAIVARTCLAAPLRLDGPAPGTPLPCPPLPATAAAADAGPAPAPALPAALFPQKDDGIAFVGVRVRRLPDRPEDLALRLAAIAAERGTWAVILSEIGQTGLERFGLRVEHLPAPGEDPAGLVLEELRAFWNLAIVVDAEEIAGFR